MSSVLVKANSLDFGCMGLKEMLCNWAKCLNESGDYVKKTASVYYSLFFQTL
jgi:hypothetical protein